MKNSLSKDEKKQVIEWIEDTAWVGREEYEKDEEYLSFVSDILENEVFCSMDQFIQHGNTTTKTHCIQVSYMSFKICKRLGWDAKSAARAGLLHDLFLYDWHTYAKETGHHFHGFTHPRAALMNAKKEFLLTAAEENMILRHMWPLTPIPPKSLEGMSIVYADKVCGLVEFFSHLKKTLAGEYHGVLERVSK